MKHTRNTAFSLVELSIVLVILGLLVGGILAGQSLIRASELRAVGAEHQRWLTAVNAFKDKYFSIPGDMATATSFWNNTGNGNGNALIMDGEAFRFWQHLQFASLIEGSLSGTHTSYQAVIGINVPASRLNGGGWSVNSNYNTSGDTNLYPITNAGTYFAFGTTDTAAPSKNITSNYILSPVEAWNIDTKLDDGYVSTGSVIGKFWSGMCGYNQTSNYWLSNNNRFCSLFFLRQF